MDWNEHRRARITFIIIVGATEAPFEMRSGPLSRRYGSRIAHFLAPCFASTLLLVELVVFRFALCVL